MFKPLLEQGLENFAHSGQESFLQNHFLFPRVEIFAKVVFNLEVHISLLSHPYFFILNIFWGKKKTKSNYFILPGAIWRISFCASVPGFLTQNLRKETVLSQSLMSNTNYACVMGTGAQQILEEVKWVKHTEHKRPPVTSVVGFALFWFFFSYSRVKFLGSLV